MNELIVLQAVRLKGRVQLTDLSATVTLDEDTTRTAVEELTATGLLLDGKAVRLTPAGRARLGDLLAQERADLDGPALAGAYAQFRTVNGTFKALVADWQLKGGQPNDHTSADYDSSVLSRLNDVHQAVLPIVDVVANQLPRLASYTVKLSAALAKVNGGDLGWFTRPLADSYHTVWFELHEELIGAAGLTREAEARAGHAE